MSAPSAAAPLAGAPAPAAPLLDVRGLRVEFPTPDGPVAVVDDVSFAVAPGECLGVVGESGSGKSITSRAVLRLVPPPGRVAGGSVVFDGTDLLALSEKRMRQVRGAQISMVFQDPTAALNPLFSIGRQLTDVIRTHTDLGRGAARARAIEVLDQVGFADARRRLGAYPFELSGGLRQRVSIALALACGPRLVIADEPTTNLDVSIQAQIIDLLLELKEQVGFAVVFISHDLGVVASVADRVTIMYAGRALEVGPAAAVLADPRQPYTQRLLRSAPTLESRRADGLPSIPGSAPRLGALGAGCPFTSRCDVAVEGLCADTPLVWTDLGGGRAASCHLLGERVPAAAGGEGVAHG
jgi:oligopeptide/dipeptide ABC transporter ATP-binding protein